MKTTRVQLELPQKSLDRLKALKETTEAASYAEVIRNALRLYESVIEEAQAGNILSIQSKDGDTKQVKPIF